MHRTLNNAIPADDKKQRSAPLFGAAELRRYIQDALSDVQKQEQLLKLDKKIQSQREEKLWQ